MKTVITEGLLSIIKSILIDSAIELGYDYTSIDVSCSNPELYHSILDMLYNNNTIPPEVLEHSAERIIDNVNAFTL